MSSEVDELPEWNNSLRSSSASSLVSAGTPDGRKDSSAAEKGGKSPPKRRMTMSMVLPEGPVIRHRYQAPPTVQTYLDKMNAEVRTSLVSPKLLGWLSCPVVWSRASARWIV